MNKKDLRELKKNFSDTSDLFTMNHVVTACRKEHSLSE